MTMMRRGMSGPDVRRFQRLRDQRRRRIFFVADHTLIALMKSRLTIEVRGLPHDAILDGVFHDFSSGGFRFAVFHESFDPVPMGEFAPLLEEKTVVHCAEPGKCIHGSECPRCRDEAMALNAMKAKLRARQALAAGPTVRVENDG